MQIEEILKEENDKQNTLIQELRTKYMRGFNNVNFRITKHFTERLCKDRRNEIHISIVNQMFSVLFREKLAEFLYYLYSMGDTDTLYLSFCDIQMVVTRQERADGRIIATFPTIYSGSVKHIYQGVAYAMKLD